MSRVSANRLRVVVIVIVTLFALAASFGIVVGSRSTTDGQERGGAPVDAGAPEPGRAHGASLDVEACVGACVGSLQASGERSAQDNEQMTQALWDARRDDSTTINVVTVDQDGRPVISTVTGVSDRQTVSEVVSTTGGAVLEWDTPVETLSNDSYRSMQWGLDVIGAEPAWPTANGTGVVVAVVDTGVSAHEDLNANLVAGYDLVDNDTTAADGHGHGTHVAGIVAAGANNGVGIAGAAPRASIMPVRVLDNNGSGYSSTVANGIVWATDNGAKVINLSLGGANTTALSAAVAYATARNVIVVAAAGNGGAGGAASYPGADPNAVGVASIDSDGQPSSFSTRGSYVDIAAPGRNILSTYAASTSSYAWMSGTSMATPFVSAAAALVAQARPSWTSAQVRTALIKTAVDVAPTGVDTSTGAGVVNVPAALAATAAWDAPAPAQLSAVVSGLDVELRATAVTGAGVAGYRFERDGTMVAQGTSTVVRDVSRATLAGSYVYSVRAVGPQGLLGQTRTLTVLINPPGTPTLTATVTGATVTLSVRATGATGYLVYRNGVQVAQLTTAPSTITLADQPAGVHAYTVRATSASGVSSASVAATVELGLAAPQNPRWSLSGLVDVTVSADSVVGAAQYQFERNGVVVATTATPQFTDAGRAAQAGSYGYTIKAVTPEGRVGAGASVAVVISPPATPSLRASATGSTVSLTMTGSSSTTGWQVYRNGSWVTTVTTANRSLTLAAQPAGTFDYSVRAVGARGVSAVSSAVRLNVVLDAPATLTATVTGTDVTLAASSVPGAVSYRFTRSGVLLADQASPVFVDRGRATIRGSYTYQVAAVDAQGTAGVVRSVSLRVNPPPTPAVSSRATGNSVAFTVSGVATNWLVYRDGILVATQPGTQTAFTLQEQAPGRAGYTVRATGPGGTSAPSTLGVVSVN